jgi:hypothetical protein
VIGVIIVKRGGLNILDLHLHSENFYQQLFNLLFGWKLQNLNAVQQNAAGVDLVDTTNKIKRLLLMLPKLAIIN